jgi:glutamate-ammonia-ligase adenylyltransferase
LGFNDPARAELAADGLGLSESALLEALAATPDPDLALSSLEHLSCAEPGITARCEADEPFRERLFAVLGTSAALGQRLSAFPEELEELRDATPRSADDLRAQLGTATDADDLRRRYHRALLRIAARDLSADAPGAQVVSVTAELSNLADAVVETALELARAQVKGTENCRLGVVALGKCGAGELNYISDVDVLFVAEPVEANGEPVCSPTQAVDIGAKWAAAMMRMVSAHSAAGTIWPIDANLRPEGKNGPLVRTLGSHEAYYAKWAKDWEFQAMLKARPMAGDRALAQDFVDMVWPLVWKVADDPSFVGEVQDMRKRVVSLLPASEADREIKLGAGGLRDVEFTVQLLQLVHGRADERLRLRGTFPALEQLIEHGYIGRADGQKLREAYEWERVLEHRVQLRSLRRTHLLPSDETNLRWLARSVGIASGEELEKAWKETARRVLSLHRHVFYSPLLSAVAHVRSDETVLTSEAAQDRLRALGYADPKAALRHIEALSTGMSRQAEIQRQLLPAMLGWFAEGPNPDYGLLAFRQVSEALGRTPWYLRALRDGEVTAEHFARVLSSSRYAVDLLMRNPQAAVLLSKPEGLTPHARERVLAEMNAAASRQDDAEEAARAIRAVRREELLRLAMGDLLHELDTEEVGQALADLASATIDAMLLVASRGVQAPPIAIIAMGRWGGRELSYASDADALVVIADGEDAMASANALHIVTKLRALLSAPGPDPALVLDLDLRPEGKGGPMLRSLHSYANYYGKWSSTWEAQALLRARHGAGDEALSAAFFEFVDPIRYPAGGLDSKQMAEIRKLKARMEVERIPRGSDPARNTKLGPGGLSDVEWVVQTLQLGYAGSHPGEPGLRGTSTLGPLRAAASMGLVSDEDAAWLQVSWMMASQIRNAIMLLRGRASDTIPSDPVELAAVANLLGYGRGESSKFLDDWHKHSRLARSVMDRLFWGE